MYFWHGRAALQDPVPQLDLKREGGGQLLSTAGCVLCSSEAQLEWGDGGEGTASCSGDAFVGRVGCKVSISSSEALVPGEAQVIGGSRYLASRPFLTVPARGQGFCVQAAFPGSASGAKFLKWWAGTPPA